MQTPHPLDGVHMNVLARERAKAHMRRAEFMVELVAHGVSKARSVIALVPPAAAHRVNSFLFSAYR